jgi:hypothetical protein
MMEATTMRKFTSFPSTCTAIAICALFSATTGAQPAPQKTAYAEPVLAVPSFNQWVNTYVVTAPEPAIDRATVQTIPWLGTTGAPTAAYQPKPVILGQPDLPLVGEAAAQAAQRWSAGLNYQGLHVKYLVLDARGVVRQVRSLGTPLRPGERFKIRLTATYSAVASIDLVVGDAWSAQRAGQIYPEPGVSVQMNAGETADLPLNPSQYFVASANPSERIVLSVRHPQATGELATNQPAYRQDGVLGSNYLQLVPHGKLPAIEQVIASSNAAR